MYKAFNGLSEKIAVGGGIGSYASPSAGFIVRVPNGEPGLHLGQWDGGRKPCLDVAVVGPALLFLCGLFLLY